MERSGKRRSGTSRRKEMKMRIKEDQEEGKEETEKEENEEGEEKEEIRCREE